MTPPPQRLAQLPAEYLTTHDGAQRFAQLPAEYLTTHDGKHHLAQLCVEILFYAPPTGYSYSQII